MHELTEKLYPYYDLVENTASRKDVDAIITDYLRVSVEKITKMLRDNLYNTQMDLSVMASFGLTSEPKTMKKEDMGWSLEKQNKEFGGSPVSGECPHVYESDCHGIEMIKDPNGKEWAIGGTETTGRWKFDPWCGKSTPRQSKLSLRESLAEKFKDWFQHKASYIGYQECGEQLADIAIAFLTQRKGEL